MKSIYKSKQAKVEIMSLYEEKLASLKINYNEVDVDTAFGRTRVIITGSSEKEKIVLFHGINAGAPLTLEAVKDLHRDFQLIAIDTIGQATKSDETVLNIKDNSYAIWADEVLDKLNITAAHFIGISYGAFILQKLIIHKPQKIKKSIFVVPSGIVNGNLWESLVKLSFPLIRFMITKKDKHLKSFIKAFVPEDDEFMFRLQKQLLLGVKIDYRRPLLVKKSDVKHFKNPIYLIEASNDIFFPGEKAAARAKQVFSNIKGVYFLKNTKHMPSKQEYSEIQQKIKEWIES